MDEVFLPVICLLVCFPERKIGQSPSSGSLGLFLEMAGGTGIWPGTFSSSAAGTKWWVTMTAPFNPDHHRAVSTSFFLLLCYCQMLWAWVRVNPSLPPLRMLWCERHTVVSTQPSLSSTQPGRTFSALSLMMQRKKRICCSQILQIEARVTPELTALQPMYLVSPKGILWILTQLCLKISSFLNEEMVHLNWTLGKITKSSEKREGHSGLHSQEWKWQ